MLDTLGEGGRSLKADALDHSYRRTKEGPKVSTWPYPPQKNPNVFSKAGVFRKSSLKGEKQLLGLLWLNQQGQKKKDPSKPCATVFRATRKEKERGRRNQKEKSHEGCKIPENKDHL